MAAVDTSTTCAHCGEPCKEGSVTFDDRSFCCTGCRSVYEILKDHDLCDYYGVDPRAGVSQRSTTHDPNTYDVLNEPLVLRRFTEWSGGDRLRLRFEVPSMHCASCVWLLDQLHKFDDGIQSSEVDFLRKTVRVDIDSTRTTAAEVGRLLSRLGYEPLLSTEGTELDVEQEKKRRTRDIYLRMGVAGFAAGNVMMISAARYLAESGTIDPTLDLVFSVLSIGLSIPVLLFSASPWFRSAIGALRYRRVNLDVPVAIGITALFARSVFDIVSGSGEGFLDSFAGLVFFLLIGRLFQQRAFDAVAFDRTYRSFFPLSVRTERKGEELVIPIERVKEGDVLLIRNGEVVPCDSVLLGNAAYVDYSFVTGEALPVECLNGSMIHAGGKVVGQAARLAAVKDVSQSYLTSLWERSGARTERRSYLAMSDRFGTWFTAIALSVAVLGFLLWLPDWHMGLMVFTSVLIIACPCALTIAAPITLGTAIGRLAPYGIFVKNSETLLELDKVDSVIFDKTGTLTDPVPDVSINALSQEGRGLSDSDLIAVRSIASNSVHPVSRAIASASHIEPTSDVVETVGKGISGACLDRYIAIGSADYMEEMTGHTVHRIDQASAYIAIDGRLVGWVGTQPRIRAGVADMLPALRERTDIALLSGDTDRDRSWLATLFAPSEMSFNNRPEDKEAFIGAHRKGRVLMVGDGLNDAAAMSAADVSIGVADGTSTLVPACDVVMPGSRIHQVALVLGYAGTMTKVIQTSLIFTVFYNALGLSLALMGVLTPVITAILMPVSSLIVIGISVLGARWYARRKLWA